MSSFTCINLAAPQKLRELSDKDFIDALYVINDDNILNDKLKNYIYYDAKVTKVSDIMMETLMVNTNINDNNSGELGGSLEETGDIEEDKTIVKNIFEEKKDEEPIKVFIKKGKNPVIREKPVIKEKPNLLLLPSNPILTVFEKILPDLGDSYYTDYFKYILKDNENNVKKIISDFVAKYPFIINQNEVNIDTIKKIIDIYTENEIEIYAPMGNQINFNGKKLRIDKDKIIYIDGEYYLMRRHLISSTITGYTKQKNLPQYDHKFKFIKVDKPLKDDELYNIICNPVDALYEIITSKMGSAAGGANQFLGSIRFFLSKNGTMPYCCNGGCFRIARNELIFADGIYPAFKSIRQACNSCDVMRTKFDEDEMYDYGYRMHVFNKKLFFINVRPSILKKKYCENAGLGPNQRNKLINNVFNNDDNDIAEFNKKLEIRAGKKEPEFADLSGAKQQCPLNLISPHYKEDDDDIKKVGKDLIGLSRIYTHLVSNCYDQDHISGSHADNVASNIWTLCKVCHSQKTLLGGDFGTKKDDDGGNIDKSKVDALNKSYRAYLDANPKLIVSQQKVVAAAAAVIDPAAAVIDPAATVIDPAAAVIDPAIGDKPKKKGKPKGKKDGSGLKKSMKGGAMYSIDDIKNEIDDNAKMFFFLVKDKKATLIAKGNDEDEAMVALSEKIAAKPEKYIGEELMGVKISLKVEGEFLIFGLIAVQLTNYVIKSAKKIKMKLIDGKYGTVWFTEKWLIYNGWDKKYLLEIVKKVVEGKVKLSAVSPNIYSMDIAK